MIRVSINASPPKIPNNGSNLSMKLLGENDVRHVINRDGRKNRFYKF
jgi:hypothetical protein